MIKNINVGDIIEVDFDYTFDHEGKIRNNLYTVVGMTDTCYKIIGMGKPARLISKKKCRLYNGRR